MLAYSGVMYSRRYSFLKWEVQTFYIPSDRARHFSNWCNIYKMGKVVHGNLSDNRCNWSNAWSSAVELY